MSTACSLAEILAAVPVPSPEPASRPAADPFWPRFFTSAGFGGLAAVTAALIAAGIAMLQLRHTRSQHLQERWWATLTWVYDRAVVEKDKRSALPHHVTFAMLTRLSERAEIPPEDRLQKSAIKSILSMFETSGDAVAIDSARGTAQPSAIHVSDPAAVLLHERLQDRLSSDQERHERDYAREVRQALDRAAEVLGARVASAGPGFMAVSWDAREVLVRARHAQDSMSSREVQQEISWLQREVAAGYTTIGGLVVVSRPVSRNAVDLALVGASSLDVVHWAEPPDDGALREALRRLRPSGAGSG